jgi:hypothetical protein
MGANVRKDPTVPSKAGTQIQRLRLASPTFPVRQEPRPPRPISN